MNQQLIRAAYEARLKAWAEARLPALPVAWQNVDFTPEQGQTYLRCFVMPAGTTSADLAGLYRVFRGVLQVTVVTAGGVGAGEASGVAAELQALFPENLRLPVGDRFVQLISPMTEAAGIPEDDAWAVPVSAQYRCDDV